MEPEQDLFNHRLKKLDEIKKLKINPYPYKYENKDNAKHILEHFKNLKDQEKITDEKYTSLRKQIRNRAFKSKKHIKENLQ